MIWIEESFHPKDGIRDRSSDVICVACDIGTTTVVCGIIDPVTKDVLASRAGANPQRSFGADVVSRIEA